MIRSAKETQAAVIALSQGKIDLETAIKINNAGLDHIGETPEGFGAVNREQEMIKRLVGEGPLQRDGRKLS